MNEVSKNVIEIYTDGGSRFNPGPSAWAWWSPTLSVYEHCYVEKSTNNEMELTAILKALRYIAGQNQSQYDSIIIYSDSAYAVNTLTYWVWTWIRSGTLSTKKNSLVISDILLIRKLLVEDEWTIKFVKVPAHSDNVGNCNADRLVNEAMDNKYMSETKFDQNFLAKLFEYTGLGGLIKTSFSPSSKVIYLELPGWSSDKDKYSIVQNIESLWRLFGFKTQVAGSIIKPEDCIEL